MPLRRLQQYYKEYTSIAKYVTEVMRTRAPAI